MSYTTSSLDYTFRLQGPFLSHSQNSASSSPSDTSSPTSTTHRPRRRHPKENPRARVSKACERCRVRKVKCDGGKPCIRCIEVDDICDYTRRSRNRDTKEYSQSYVDQLLDQNNKFKAAMRVLYANRRLSIHPDDMMLPQAEEKDLPLVHEILDQLGLLREDQAHTEVQSEESCSAVMEQPRLQRADTTTNSVESVNWSSTFDFTTRQSDDRTPTGTTTYAPSSSANTEYESTFDMNLPSSASNNYFGISTLPPNAQPLDADDLMCDFDMGPSVSFEDLEAMGNLMDQNKFMGDVLAEQCMPMSMFEVGGLSFHDAGEGVAFTNSWTGAPAVL